MPKRTSVKKHTNPIINRIARQLKIKRTPLTLAFQHLEPSWRAFLFYVDIAAREGHKDMIQLMEAYYKLTRQEQASFNSPEYLCEVAQVPVRSLLSAIAPLMWEFGHFESTTVKEIERPRVLGRLAKEAEKPGVGHIKERELFLKVTGDVPLPHGNVTNIAAVGSTGSQIGRGPLPALPSPGQDIMELEAQDHSDADDE